MNGKDGASDFKVFLNVKEKHFDKQSQNNSPRREDANSTEH
jgi:hypothetical protein